MIANNKFNAGGNTEAVELLRKLLITVLATAGVKQTAIREIVRCDMNRVNRITKHMRKDYKNAERH